MEIDQEKLKQWEKASKKSSKETRKLLDETYWMSAEKGVMEEINRELVRKKLEENENFGEFMDLTQELGI